MMMNKYLGNTTVNSTAKVNDNFITGTIFDNLPHDMRALSQWGFVKPDSRIALFINQNGETQYAASNNPYTWMSYKDAVAEAVKLNGNIAFFLWHTDPFCCVDIDTRFTEDEINNDEQKRKKWNFHQIVKSQFLDKNPTYAEISAGGIDTHIWCRANSGIAKKLKLPYQDSVIDGIELYSSNHYIVCTGKTLNPDVKLAIYKTTDIDALISADIGSSSHATSTLEELPQTEDDITVMDKLFKLDFCHRLWNYVYEPKSKKYVNHEKKWAHDTYFSQSEADYVLLHQLCRLSPSNAQVTRLFRQSNLGLRPKANRNSYIRTTLEDIRGSLEFEKSENLLIANALAVMRQGNLEELAAAAAQEPAPKLVSTRKRIDAIKEMSIPDLSHIFGHNPDLFDIGTDDLLDFPIGVLGDYAKWICYKCTSPLVEGAITHALGLVSGIAGRHYKINEKAQTGINQPLVLTGQSGIGKDVISDGFGFLRVNAHVDKRIEDFLRIGHKISHVNSMREMITDSPYLSVLHYIPEFSKKLNAAATGDKLLQAIIEEWLDLYNSTHSGRIYGDYLKTGHSKNSESKVSGVTEACYVSIGDCTEEDLNRSLNAGMLEDGSLSRIICIYAEYDPIQHIPHNDPLPKYILDNINQMIDRVCSDLDVRTMVKLDSDAEQILNAYNIAVMLQLYKLTEPSDSTKRVAYSRSRLKVWRIAGILAVFDNPITPIISKDNLLWAIGLVNRDSKKLLSKIKSCDIGGSADDFDRMDAIRRVILEYLKAGTYKDKNMQRYVPALQEGCVVFTAINARLRGTTMFKADNKANKLPAATLISVSLNLLQREGFLRIMSSEEMQSKYGLRCEGYEITNYKEIIHAMSKKYAR